MANKVNLNRSLTEFKLNLSPEQKAILQMIGNGNMRQGLLVAIDQAGHFWNCGLEPEMDVRFVGLVTTLPSQDED